MPEPDCFLRCRISHGMQNFTSGKSDVYVFVAASTRGFTMVSFNEAVKHLCRRYTSKHLCRRYMRSTECPSSFVKWFCPVTCVTAGIEPRHFGCQPKPVALTTDAALMKTKHMVDNYSSWALHRILCISWYLRKLLFVTESVAYHTQIRRDKILLLLLLLL